MNRIHFVLAFIVAFTTSCWDHQPNENTPTKTNVFIYNWNDTDSAQDVCEAEEVDAVEEETQDNCAGSVLHVPADCPTIQSAVDATQTIEGEWRLGLFPAPLTTVLIAPGTYHESVKVVGDVNILITKDGDGEVIIDGGAESAISTMNYGGALISLYNLTLQSEQVNGGYGMATVFMEFCEIVNIESVTIHTKSIGLTTNYIGDAQVVDSTFIGDGTSGTQGISWNHADTGSRIFYNTFQDLGTGVYRCSGSEPKFTPILNEDSNHYYNVGTNYVFDQSCQ